MASSSSTLFVNPISGNVGIGTTLPITKLHINDNIYSPGTIIQTIYYQHLSASHLENNNGQMNASGIQVTITPKSINSKIMLTFCSFCSYATANTNLQINILRNNTTGLPSTTLYQNTQTGYFPVTITAFDTPATITPTIYQVYYGIATSPNRSILVHNNYVAYLIAQEIGG